MANVHNSLSCIDWCVGWGLQQTVLQGWCWILGSISLGKEALLALLGVCVPADPWSAKAKIYVDAPPVVGCQVREWLSGSARSGWNVLSFLKQEQERVRQPLLLSFGCVNVDWSLTMIGVLFSIEFVVKCLDLIVFYLNCLAVNDRSLLSGIRPFVRRVVGVVANLSWDWQPWVAEVTKNHWLLRETTQTCCNKRVQVGSWEAWIRTKVEWCCWDLGKNGSINHHTRVKLNPLKLEVSHFSLDKLKCRSSVCKLSC